MTVDRLNGLQQALGHSFAHPEHLHRALTHRSFGAAHNERLEFLGDAVLNVVISVLLFERFSGSDEGDLTRVRAHLVREDSLHQVALTLGLSDLIRLSEGEARGGGAQRASILADAVEALIAATFLDGGYEAARQVVTRLFGDVIAAGDVGRWSKDAKTALQEWLQARKLSVPVYRIVATHGQAHAQTFEVVCEVSGPAGGAARLAHGQGRSRRAAEQEAARQMLDMLNQLPSTA